MAFRQKTFRGRAGVFFLALLLCIPAIAAFGVNQGSRPLIPFNSSMKANRAPLSQGSSFEQEKNVNVSKPAQRGWRASMFNWKVQTVATAVIVSSAAAVAFPSLGIAADISSISGGALSMAQSTSVLWERLTDSGFYQAFSLVFLSEIGDKTFFIAGLLAMKTSKIVSFAGSVGALAVMTVLSVLIGQIFHAVPSGIADGIPLDDVAAALAFAFFGVKILKDALDMEEGQSIMDEELAEAEETVQESSTVKINSAWGQFASIFALVFAAEFGDRSFISTIALSAAQNPVSVAAGGIAAHAVATGIAVSGGSYIAKYISERAIGIIGGCFFLIFAVTTALGIF